MNEGVSNLKYRSGLTWDETARALGVSCRTVHAWAGGARVSGAYAGAVKRLADAVDRVVAGSPAKTRAALFGPDDQGISPYQRLARELTIPGSRREGFAPWELL